MKRLIVFLIILLSFPIAFSQELLAPTEVTCYTGESKTFEILVRNEQNFADDFSISVFPQNIEGVQILLENYFVSLLPKEEKNIKVFVFVPDCIREFSSTFTISVKSSKTNELKQKSIYLNVKGKAVCITDLFVDKKNLNPEETVSFEISLTNPSETESSPLILKVLIKDPYENVVKSFEDSIEKIQPKTTKKILHSYRIEKFAKPGAYEVKAILVDGLNKMIDSSSAKFYVNPTYTNYPEKSTHLSILSSTVTIKIKNEGNSPTPPFYISESLPAIARFFFQPEKKPDKEEIVGNSVIYYWLIETIEPGKEITITYKISLINLWLICVAVIFLGYVGYKFVFTPTLVKKSSYVGKLEPEKEITISIGIKNRSRHSIEDVKIRDFVPSILKISEKFDTVRPKIRKTSSGVYLIWEFDSLRPGEERILTYRIKPVLEIGGTLRLPKAIMTYVDKNKVKKILLSKTMTLKPE